jgi:yecA family protein
MIRSDEIRKRNGQIPFSDGARNGTTATETGGRAMNVEQLGGFFAALIAGPKTVMPSEYSREVFGGEMSEACVRQPRRSQ